MPRVLARVGEEVLDDLLVVLGSRACPRPLASPTELIDVEAVAVVLVGLVLIGLDVEVGFVVVPGVVDELLVGVLTTEVDEIVVAVLVVPEVVTLVVTFVVVVIVVRLVVGEVDVVRIVVEVEDDEVLVEVVVTVTGSSLVLHRSPYIRSVGFFGIHPY